MVNISKSVVVFGSALVLCVGVCSGLIWGGLKFNEFLLSFEAGKDRYERVLKTLRTSNSREKKILKIELSKYMEDGKLTISEFNEFQERVPKIIINDELGNIGF